MAPTPTWKMNQGHTGHSKTPLVKRLHFTAGRLTHHSPNPNSAVKENQAAAEHPVEVVGRIRHYPERKERGVSVVQVNSEGCSIRVKADFGYRDFGLDGISMSEEEDLEGFYNKFVESRVSGVKIGGKCTVMMYGPTGSGKSYTMFGCAKQQGIVYRCLRDILGEEGVVEEVPTLVQVTVLEIYNEEIYDLLSTGSGGGGGGSSSAKGNSSKVRLEVMGKKAKNASFISGKEAGKIAKEIEKVEKRRIVKSTLCNERSSRSHCMIIMDVPSVGGRLMLVDMAGSENIDQAGQGGLEAKMQTAKINQGNIALKRVVESIANADSHVPFRDSKLTMLLQDSFEDDKSKILMILCVSPDPKEVFKTVLTLEYGAKAKCIVRGPHSPPNVTSSSHPQSSMLILGSRLAAMDHFISKLQTENRLKERLLLMKENEVSQLRARLEPTTDQTDSTIPMEEEINRRVKEQTHHLRSELERKAHECQNMAAQFVELSKKMEEKTIQHQIEIQTLLLRREELESKVASESPRARSTLARRMTAVWGGGGDEVPGMVMSMDLDTGDQDETQPQDHLSAGNHDCASPAKGSILGTVFEVEAEGEEVEEVKKEVIEEGTVYSSKSRKNGGCYEGTETASSRRRVRINNIFTLCGNNREISQKTNTTTTLATTTATPKKESEEDVSFGLGSVNRVNGFDEKLKENRDPDDDEEKKRVVQPMSSDDDYLAVCHHHQNVGGPVPMSPLFPLSPIENKRPVVAGKKGYHTSHIVPVIVPRC